MASASRGPEGVGEVQRARMLRAACEVASELGYGGMSVARVTGRAGMSRRTFYDLFEDREDCFLAVFEEGVSRAQVVVLEAVDSQTVWRERIRAGLAALLGFLDEDRPLGSLLVVDALAAGPKVLARRAEVLNRLHAALEDGRGPGTEGHRPPPLAAEGVVGAVLSVVHSRMLERDPRPILELLNPLMAIVLLPYLGRAAVAKELNRSVPTVASAVSSRPPRDPLEGLDMRLTYRTLRVLSTIALDPGASNRRVADLAGVADQGQISKLLGRLETLGLIEKTVGGQPKGEPNAWNLTPRGREVEQAVRLQAERTGARRAERTGARRAPNNRTERGGVV